MVDLSASLGTVFHALSSDARRLVLDRLLLGPLTVGQIAEPLDMSLAAVSKHLQVLQRAGLVTVSVHGRRHVCSVVPGSLEGARQWLDAAAEGAPAPAPRWQRQAAAEEEID